MASSVGPQGYDGIEHGGFARGVDAEEDAGGGGDDEASHNAPDGDGRREADGEGNRLRHGDAAENTDEPAHERHHRGLQQELHEDVFAACAEGLADADLASALGDGDEHDVHDDDAAHDERDGGDGSGDGTEGLGEAAGKAYEGVVCVQLEGIFSTGGIVALRPHEDANLVRGAFEDRSGLAVP